MDSFWFDTMLELSPSDCLWVGKLDRVLFTIVDSDMFWNVKRKRDGMELNQEFETKKNILNLYRRRMNIQKDIEYVVTNFISIKDDGAECTSLQYLEDETNHQFIDCHVKKSNSPIVSKRYQYTKRNPIVQPEESYLFQRPSFKKRRELTNSYDSDECLTGYEYEFSPLNENCLMDIVSYPGIDILYQDVDVVIYTYMLNVKICHTMYISSFDMMEEKSVRLGHSTFFKNLSETKIVSKRISNRFVVLIENHIFDVDFSSRLVQTNDFSIPGSAICSAVEMDTDSNVAYFHVNYGPYSRTICIYCDPNSSPPYNLEHISSFMGFTSCVFWENSLRKKYLVYYSPALGDVMFYNIRTQCEGNFNIYFQIPKTWNEKQNCLVRRYKMYTTKEKIFIQTDRTKWIMLTF